MNATQPAVVPDLLQPVPKIPQEASNLPPIEKASDILQQPLKLPPEIIHGVLHKGLKAVLGGGSKTCKSWTLLDVALSVATGRPWWNFPTTKGKVLFINFEIPKEFMHERLLSICNRKEIQLTDTEGLHLLNLRGKGGRLGNLVNDIVTRAKPEGYSLIIIDPIYKGLGNRDENKAGDIGELCNELERIAVETEAAIFYAAHFTKGNQAGKEAIDRISGSGVWTRDADAIVTLTKHKEELEKAYTVDFIVRNRREPEPFVVAWDFPLMVLRDDLNPEDLKDNRGRAKLHEEQELLDILGKNRLTTSEWKDLAEKEGIKESTFFRLLRSLKKTGRVGKPAEDDKYEALPGPRGVLRAGPNGITMSFKA